MNVINTIKNIILSTRTVICDGYKSVSVGNTPLSWFFKIICYDANGSVVNAPVGTAIIQEKLSETVFNTVKSYDLVTGNTLSLAVAVYEKLYITITGSNFVTADLIVIGTPATTNGTASNNPPVTISVTGNPSSVYVANSFTLTATLSGGFNESGHVISVTTNPIDINISITNCTLSTASPTGTITVTPQLGTTLQNYIFSITDSKGGTVIPNNFVTQVLPKWFTLGSAGFSAGITTSTSLAISTSGIQYVAYPDSANSNKATVMQFNGINWVNVGTAGFSAGTATSMSLAINPLGVPYVAYSDGANSNKTTVMQFNGTAWVNVGTAGFSVGTANFISLAINPIGILYVVYRDGANSNKATVMTFNGTAWVNVGTAGFSAGATAYNNIAIDPSGVPYVVYQNNVAPFKATTMKFNGTSWVNVGNANFSIGTVDSTRIAINSLGVPYVAYQDRQNIGIGKATVMRFNGTSWVNVGNEDFSVGRANQITLALNSSGVPYVAYNDGANGGKATVMQFDGTNWVNVGNAGFSAGTATSVSLAINPSGIPYVAYVDDANGSKATVMYLD